MDLGALLSPHHAFLQDRWREWFSDHPDRIADIQQRALIAVGDGSLGHEMCRFSCTFLLQALRQDPGVFGQGWRIVGGMPTMKDGLPTGGYCPPGQPPQVALWLPHFWLQRDKPAPGLILDLTAAQFGDQSIIVTELEDLRYAGNMSAEDVIAATQSVKRTVNEWLDLWHEEKAYYEGLGSFSFK